jgi:hypothetical protein
MEVAVVALAVLVVVPSSVFANTITNGGFETGNFSGWLTAGIRSSRTVNVDSFDLMIELNVCC